MINNKANDELQELWNRGQITEYALKIQSQYEKVVEQNRQLQQERMQLISNNNFINSELNQIKLLLEGKNTECSVFKERSEKYEQALDDIEKMIKKDVCLNCEDYYCDCCDYKDTLDIIDKAKGVEND